MTRDTDLTGGAPMGGNDATDGADVIADLAAYWQSIRRGIGVPRRSDIDPRGIEPLLSNAFVAERIAPGLARIRIAGSHLTDLMGMEVRGMPISAFITPAHRDALSHHLVRLFDQPAILRLSLGAPGPHAARGPSGTMLILPLRSDLGDISRTLGCFVTQGIQGSRPHRFDITHAEITPLEGAVPLPAPAAPSPPPDRPEPPRRGERPYLRLVKG